MDQSAFTEKLTIQSDKWNIYMQKLSILSFMSLMNWTVLKIKICNICKFLILTITKKKSFDQKL